MKTDEIRALKTEEIRRKIDETREEYMNLRFQTAIGSLKDHTRLSQTRKVIAQLLTILHEKQSTEEGEA